MARDGEHLGAYALGNVCAAELVGITACYLSIGGYIVPLLGLCIVGLCLFTMGVSLGYVLGRWHT